MTSNKWWDNIPKGTVVCLQASDMEDVDHVNKFTNDRELFKAYPLEELLYSGIKRFEFNDKGFYRSMIIGIK
jgi:hypothetical protein